MRARRSLIPASQPVAVEKRRGGGGPVSGLLFTGNRATAASSADTRIEIGADDAPSPDSPFAPHRAAPAVIWGKRNSNLQMQKIVAVADPLFPIVFNNGKSNWSA